VAPFLISLGLKRDPLWERYQSYSLASGVASIGLFLLFSAAVWSSFPDVGLLQRGLLAVSFLWIELMAIHLLRISNQTDPAIAPSSQPLAPKG
jgi:hypothetical protein